MYSYVMSIYKNFVYFFISLKSFYYMDFHELEFELNVL